MVTNFIFCAGLAIGQAQFCCVSKFEVLYILNYFLKSLTKLSLKSFISDRTTHSLADFLVGSSNIELLHRILFSSVFATARRCYVQVSRMVSFFLREAHLVDI